jgi:hypothetical protein
MLQTKAVFNRKEPQIEAADCVVDKVIRLSGAEFDHFSRNLTRDWDFLRDNQLDSAVDNEGRFRCLLVVGEGRRDGILVKGDGKSYARYSAFMPNAGDFLTVGQYPALAELNKKLADIVDFIAKPTGQRYIFDIREFENMTGSDFMHNAALLNTVVGMLDGRPEGAGLEIDKNELIIYYSKGGLEKPAEAISDPSVTKTDMYAYGYGWEGMIPLGKERALELFDEGYVVYRLYENDAEGMADDRESIESFDGMFGVEGPALVREAEDTSIEVFILNREKHDKGENIGKWLKLPANAGTLYDLFLHIGIDKPGEGMFTITAVRAPDFIRDHVSKYDSLDELNLLASCMKGLEDFELEKFRLILEYKGDMVGSGTAALINLLHDENLDAFNWIDADSPEALGRHYAVENDEKPDGVSFEEYGYQCVREEKGVFTGEGYLYCRYGKLLPEYDGVVPDESKITSMALHAFRFTASERGLDEKPSVMKQIRESQKAPKPPRNKKTPDKKKGGQEL